MAETHQSLRWIATQMDEGECKVEWKIDDLYTIILKIYIHFKLLNWKYVQTQSFYYSCSKFSKFIQGKSPLLQ